MKKNTVLAVVLSMCVILISMYLQKRFFPPLPQDAGRAEASISNTDETNTDTNDLFISEPVETQDISKKEQFYTIETDLVSAVFTNKGGDICSYKLKKHFSAGKKELVEMVRGIDNGDRAFSLYFGGAECKPLNVFLDVTQAPVEKGGQSISFSGAFQVKDSAGNTSVFNMIKKYTFFPDDYMFTVDVQLEGAEDVKNIDFSGFAYSLSTAPQIGPKQDPADRYEYRKFSSFSNKKMREIKVKAGTETGTAELAEWTAVYGKYFAVIVMPSEPIQNAKYSAVKHPLQENPDSRIFINRKAVQSSRLSDLYKIYIGPNSEKDLNKYNMAKNNHYGLQDTYMDLTADSGGILGPLEKLLKWMLEKLNMLTGNWGVSILLLTFIMRLVFFPLTKKSSEATRKMQEMQPEIKAIQEKYKSNPQKINSEMAKLYKETGHNPLMGCLPMLIQIPFLYAMFRLFNNYFEFRGASFIPLWIPDLSVGDSILHFGFKIPVLQWTDLRLLPIIYLISQLIYGKVTQQPGQADDNPSMKMMLYIMPIMFFFLFYNVPSGLLLFWTFSNILMLVQQVIINKTLEKKEQEEKNKPIRRK